MNRLLFLMCCVTGSAAVFLTAACRWIAATPLWNYAQMASFFFIISDLIKKKTEKKKKQLLSKPMSKMKATVGKQQ